MTILGTSLPDAFQKVLQSHTKELKKEVSMKKEEYKDFIKESVQANVRNEIKKSSAKASSKGNIRFCYSSRNTCKDSTLSSSIFISTSIRHPSTLFDALTWSIELDNIRSKKDRSPEKVLKKRDRGDDKDEDPSAGPNQGKETKKRRTGKEAESS
ncbi:hypothetical protein Tco_1222162 [Tanacetum coccineum]